MTQYILAAFIGIGIVAFIAMVIYSALTLKSEVPTEDREHMDPLPRGLRIIWPIIRFTDYHFCQRVPDRWVAGPTDILRQTGLLYLMSGRQFFALGIVSSTGFGVLSVFAMNMLDIFVWYIFLGAVGFGLIYPHIWLKEQLAKRRKLILKSLPAYLDFLTMGVEAGLNMAGAIQQAVLKGPIGPLKNEFGLVLRDLRSGLTRTEALRRMEDRIRMTEVTSFVNAVVQAERLGASLANTFRFQADQRRTERFQRAEKLAMEAPVKLIFPLVAFIFPVTFIVLMFPIAIKFMESGAF